MPYSRQRTVEAVGSYYKFLQRLYLDDDKVLWPPTPGGWPQITEDSLADLDKDGTVIELLKHLPYVQQMDTGADRRCIGSGLYAVQYNDVDGIQSSLDYGNRYICIEPYPYAEDGLPPHVVCLATMCHRDATFLLIDTKEGAILWGNFISGPSCMPAGTIEFDPGEDSDSDSDAYDWIQGFPRWPVEEFFEVLKEKFRRCEWLAHSDEDIRDHTPNGEFGDPDDRRLESILRNAGWPGDGEGYNWDREKAIDEWYDYQDQFHN